MPIRTFAIRRHHLAAAAVLVVVGAAFFMRLHDGPPMVPVEQLPPRAENEVAALPPIRPTDVHPKLGYPLDDVVASKAAPPIFIERLRVDLSRIPDIDEKKETFFRILLPYVARENDHIRTERQRIESSGGDVPLALYEKYDVEPGDIEGLLSRVDVVPASLVLAQAALESGWGSSRFALQGNNFFGMRTYDDDRHGMKPKEADGFKVMTFKDIGHSVRAYIRTINTHGAYASLRKARAGQRAAGLLPSGHPLTKFLTAYSEIPEKYGALLRGVIKAAGLERFDGVRLADN